MQKVTIQIPKGYEIDSFDKVSGEIRFKETPRSVIERIKTTDDVLADNGLNAEEFEDQCEGMTQDEVAYRLLKLLAKSLNEGWTPDWNDANEEKYYPWFEMGGSSGFRFFGYVYWSSRSLVGSRLCFKSRELAVHAGTTFTEVYQKMMVI